MSFISKARARPFLVGALALAFTALAPRSADAQTLDFTWSVLGCFGAPGCTYLTTDTEQGLTFTGGNDFTGTATGPGDGTYLLSVGNAGAGFFTLSGTPYTYNGTQFNIMYSFTAPSAGDNVFTASLTGTVVSDDAGNVSINWGPLADRTSTWFGTNGEIYTLTIHDQTGVNTQEPGYIDFEVTASTVPEPMSVVLMGTGLAGVAVIRRRRQKLTQADLV